MSNAISLNGRLAARWARRAVDRLRKERTEIDELNVFPVPDGDTGTNMYHTLRAAYLAVEELTGPVTLPHVVAALAAGAGRGARGNSGLILAVALQGVADALDGVTVATADAMAAVLPADSSLYRVGGDEFAAVLPAVPGEGGGDTATAIATDLVDAARTVLAAHGAGISAGLAWRGEGEEPIDTLRRADEALYVAKGTGGGVRRAGAPHSALTLPGI